MEKNIILEDFINQFSPHDIANGPHPPSSGKERHDWESKLLFSVYNKLDDKCRLLDYGCGTIGTLQHTLFKRYPNATYCGLDVKGKRGFNKKSTDNVYMGTIDELPEKLKEVDCVVAGSVFSHLPWESIKDVLNKLKPFFENGGEFGFTTILNKEYKLIGHDHYGPNTYGMAILTKKHYQEYCDQNDLVFEVLPFNHSLGPNNPYKEQSYCNIKKSTND